MLVKRIYLILYFSALWAIAIEAAPLPRSRVIALQEQFKTHQQQTKTWSASFTQTLSLPGMQKTVVSKGKLMYRARGELRLDFVKPEGEFVLVVGDELFLQKAGKHVEVKSLADDLEGKPFGFLLAFLRGSQEEEISWYITQVSSENGKYYLMLNRKPEAPDILPIRITNTIDIALFEVREIFVELPNGSTIKYHFDAVLRNGAIDSARFSPPASE